MFIYIFLSGLVSFIVGYYQAKLHFKDLEKVYKDKISKYEGNDLGQ